MDPGAFGALTITKSLTIDGGGFIAGVLSTNGSNGIVINAGPNDVVTLRRLQINGAGTGNNGVRILGAKHVNIEDTEIIGFSANGVDVQPAAASTVVHITDSRINNHGNAGVRVVAGNVMVASSSLVGNTYAGVDASSSLSLVLVSGSTLSMNGRGLRASTNAMIRMTHNDIVFNTTYAWENAGGTIETHVDNRVRGTTVGALTTVSYP